MLSLQIAIVYLGVLGLAGFTFVFTSFWVYHYIDLDQDALYSEAEAATTDRTADDLHLRGPNRTTTC